MLRILEYALQFLHFEGMYSILQQMVVLGEDMIFVERRRLIINSVWLEIFVVSFFDWSIFGKYRFRLVLWKCSVFCKDK